MKIKKKKEQASNQILTNRKRHVAKMKIKKVKSYQPVLYANIYIYIYIHTYMYLNAELIQMHISTHTNTNTELDTKFAKICEE